jgi:hypothetical protein
MIVRIIDRHLSPQKRQFRRGHAIVMALAATTAVIAAAVLLGMPSDAQVAASEVRAAQIARYRAAARVCRIRPVYVDSACAALEPLP